MEPEIEYPTAEVVKAQVRKRLVLSIVELRDLGVQQTPASRYRALVVTKLEEALLWLSAEDIL